VEGVGKSEHGARFTNCLRSTVHGPQRLRSTVLRRPSLGLAATVWMMDTAGGCLSLPNNAWTGLDPSSPSPNKQAAFSLRTVYVGGLPTSDEIRM
jgi:hypothetical protein